MSDFWLTVATVVGLDLPQFVFAVFLVPDQTEAKKARAQH